MVVQFLCAFACNQADEREKLNAKAGRRSFKIASPE